METTRFDRLAITVGQRATRRAMVSLIAALGLAGLVREEVAAACLDNDQRCGGTRGTCCSGRCVRKSGTRKKFCKPAAGQGTCTVEQDRCVTFTGTCNGNADCSCAITRRGQSFCRGIGLCTRCKGDAKCVRLMGSGSKCVRCPTCGGGALDTSCSRPCPTQI